MDAEDHAAGPLDVPIIIVEYGDFESAQCGALYWELKRLQRGFQGRVTLVWRHFPMTQVHANALHAAEAAEAAASQGRFWEMHDLLFENQDDLDPAALFAYADDLGLELKRFAAEVNDHRHQARIERDFLSGARSGVTATPGLFVNGVQVQRAQLAQTLDGLLGAARPSIG